MVDESRLQSHLAEGQNDLDALAGVAAAERARIDLVVSAFEVPSILSEEGKGDLGPVSVAPVRANEEGDRDQAVALHGLDGEEQVAGGSGFEIMDGYVRRKIHIATSGTEAKL